MNERQIEMHPLLGSIEGSVSDRTSETNERRYSSRAFSWYLAQPALPNLKYVLTTNGYLILP
jgi:hypothetical protein